MAKKTDSKTTQVDIAVPTGAHERPAGAEPATESAAESRARITKLVADIMSGPPINPNARKPNKPASSRRKAHVVETDEEMHARIVRSINAPGRRTKGPMLYDVCDTTGTTRIIVTADAGTWVQIAGSTNVYPLGETDVTSARKAAAWVDEYRRYTRAATHHAYKARRA